MVHTVIKEFGWIDGLINNAGGAVAPKTLKAAGQNIHRIVFRYIAYPVILSGVID